jgi:hypothetical protein
MKPYITAAYVFGTAIAVAVIMAYLLPKAPVPQEGESRAPVIQKEAK